MIDHPERMMNQVTSIFFHSDSVNLLCARIEHQVNRNPGNSGENPAVGTRSGSWDLGPSQVTRRRVMTLARTTATRAAGGGYASSGGSSGSRRPASGWSGLRRSRDPRARCAVELTELRVEHQDWWSLGLEATGPAGALRHGLEATAALVFSGALPDGVDLRIDDSRSYADWLRSR
jgi:hypothetical protein